MTLPTENTNAPNDKDGFTSHPGWEFFNIFSMTALPALITSISAYRYGYFENTFRNTYICFATCLALYHVYFYLIRAKSTPNVIRFIDYAYLSVAALGLISSVDFTVRQYTDEVNSIVIQSFNDISYTKEALDAQLSAGCKDENSSLDCNVLHRFDRLAEYVGHLSISARNYYNANHLTTQAAALADGSEKIKDIIIHQEPNIYSDLHFLKRLKFQPFGYDKFDDWWNYIGIRSIGFYFFASALALRITRVTIELNRWTR